MTSLSALIHHNVAYLSQASALLDELDDASFVECRKPVYTSGIGDHLRHILEHYQCLVDGLATDLAGESCEDPAGAPNLPDYSLIDYDARARDRRMASNRGVAAEVIRDLRAKLLELPAEDRPLRVRLDGSNSGKDSDPWSTSTLKRELQYLQAHTVHHFALIAFILRIQGREPNPAFGVAPSTLRHRAGA